MYQFKEALGAEEALLSQVAPSPLDIFARRAQAPATSAAAKAAIQAARGAVPTPGDPSTTKTTPGKKSGPNWLLIGGGVAALGVVIFLLRKKRG